MSTQSTQILVSKYHFGKKKKKRKEKERKEKKRKKKKEKKEPGLPGAMANSGSGVGDLQNDSRTSYCTRKKGIIRNTGNKSNGRNPT